MSKDISEQNWVERNLEPLQRVRLPMALRSALEHASAALGSEHPQLIALLQSMVDDPEISDDLRLELEIALVAPQRCKGSRDSIRFGHLYAPKGEERNKALMYGLTQAASCPEDSASCRFLVLSLSDKRAGDFAYRLLVRRSSDQRLRKHLIGWLSEDDPRVSGILYQVLDLLERWIPIDDEAYQAVLKLAQESKDSTLREKARAIIIQAKRDKNPTRNAHC